MNEGYTDSKACGGQLGPRIQHSRYVGILNRCFWQNGALMQSPWYPGSVAIAQEVGMNFGQWICGDTDPSARRELRASLPYGSLIRPSLADSRGFSSRVAGQIRPQSLLFIDPFNLNRSVEARSLWLDAATTGAITIAWYPMYRPQTPRRVDMLRRRARVAECAVSTFEVSWANTHSQSMSGAGLLVARRLGGATARRLQQLQNAAPGLPDRARSLRLRRPHEAIRRNPSRHRCGAASPRQKAVRSKPEQSGSGSRVVQWLSPGVASPSVRATSEEVCDPPYR